MTGHESTPSDRKSQALPKSQAANPLQTELAITHAPAKVRARLRETHLFPLVSDGKRKGQFSSFRVHASEAWKYKSIELRSATAFPCLILDIDSRERVNRLREAVLLGILPEANWVVQRVKGEWYNDFHWEGTKWVKRTVQDLGGCHAVWCLERPVHRGAMARDAPLRFLARPSEYFAAFLEADRGFAGVLSHNPMAAGHGPGFITAWGRPEPYDLAELGSFVPRGWRIPKQPSTAVGRNYGLFKDGMRWAGSKANIELLAESWLLITNQRYDVPLPPDEVRGIARSIERYRSRWIEQGKYYSDAETEAWGRSLGIKSGKVRRGLVKDRDAAIIQSVMKGQSQADVAGRFGIDQTTISRILCRDAPLWTRETISGAKPWESDGISRATWYRTLIP